MDCSCNGVHDALGPVSLRLVVLEMAWRRSALSPLPGRRRTVSVRGAAQIERSGPVGAGDLAIGISQQYDVAQFWNALVVLCTLELSPCRYDAPFSR